jgi:hypothetical protein
MNVCILTLVNFHAKRFCFTQLYIVVSGLYGFTSVINGKTFRKSLT